MIAAVQFIALVGLAPLSAGLLRGIRARLQGRPGPSLWQPYRDLRKLWAKEALVPARASAIVTLAPGVAAGVALGFAAFVPPTGGGPLSPGNAVAIALLLGLGRFALVAAALDVRSAFTAMAASRAMTFASLTEAPLLLALLAVSLPADPAGQRAPVAALLAAAALLLVMLSETARVPVDNQATHYELTMIEEGLNLEYSGWHLALVQGAAQVRTAAFILIAAQMMPGGPVATLGWIVLVMGLIPLIERQYAKLRLFEVPQLFAAATVLAFASIGLRVAGLGAW